MRVVPIAFAILLTGNALADDATASASPKRTSG
jgi:hypothetical protein